MREAVAEARAAGAQLIVVTMHSGLSEPATYDTVATGLPSDNVAARVAREVPGVDVIAYGHSHKEMPDTTINGVLLMQAKNWVQSVAVANLRLVRDGTAWRVASKSSPHWCAPPVTPSRRPSSRPPSRRTARPSPG